MSVRALIAGGAFFLAACGAREARQADPPPPPPPDFLTIGPGGALGIDASLPYTQQELSARISDKPGIIVAAESVQVARRVFTALRTESDGLELYQFWPSAKLDVLRAIHTESPAVIGPAGEVIGASTLRDAREEDVAFCRETMATGARLLECAPDPGAAFWRIYRLAPGGPSEGAAALGPQEAAVLVAMRWVAVGALPAPQESFSPL